MVHFFGLLLVHTQVHVQLYLSTLKLLLYFPSATLLLLLFGKSWVQLFMYRCKLI